MIEFHVGTDVGGTFTDLWVSASDGRSEVVKTPTSEDVVGGILSATELAAAAFELELGEFLGSVRRFGHGCTVGLNALLTGRVARTAVVTTAGFGDTLEIGRMKRYVAGLSDLELSDYYLRGRHQPIVPRHLVVEVPERIDRDGAVVLALSDEALERAVATLAAAEVDAVAVCLLWSTASSVHEEQLARRISEALPGVFVCASHEVSPSVGEYARMSTTAVNAALGPVMSGYLDRLSAVLTEAGLRVPVLAMTSTGGVVPAATLARLPVAGIMSGPAAGVIGSCARGRREGLRRLLTIDVGGTSFDVSTVIDGDPLLRTESVVAGADVRFPGIDVGSIGAGGGSIARVSDGVLSVGPESAGANPGPACYGRGGTEPTTTDADVVLGVFGGEGMAGGSVRLDVEAARRAVRALADPLGLSAEEAAWSVRLLVDSKMADLVRRVTIERGHDPREFVMVASGGSGPSHAWSLCRELGITSFVVPATASVQSAYGTGTSEMSRSVERTCYLRIAGEQQVPGEANERVAATLDRLVEEIAGEVTAEQPGLGLRFVRSLSLRYRGQAHHLDVPLPADSRADLLAAALERFESDYESLFGPGSAFREAGFEVLAARVLAIAELPAHDVRPSSERLAYTGTRGVFLDDPAVPIEVPVFRAVRPAPGQELEGPCLVVYPSHTAVVPPGATARTGAGADLVVELSPPAARAASDAGHASAGRAGPAHVGAGA